MKYEKPQLIVEAAATASIQGQEKGPAGLPDSPLEHTIGAYESDE